MKTTTNLLVYLLICVTLLSCSKEEDVQLKQEVYLEFAKNEAIKDSKSKSDTILFKIEIISTSPLRIKSPDLVVSEATHAETGARGYVISQKAYKTENRTGKQKGDIEPFIIGKRGYWYDGDDCFIYGTIYTDTKTGEELFVPADSTTQYLMNKCGFSNMA